MRRFLFLVAFLLVPLGDVAALATKLRQPFTARLLVVPGKGAGETTEFEPRWLTNTRVLALD